MCFNPNLKSILSLGIISKDGGAPFTDLKSALTGGLVTDDKPDAPLGARPSNPLGIPAKAASPLTIPTKAPGRAVFNGGSITG